MPGTDGYYHIKIAWLMRTLGILDTFPWATQSLWSEHFYDKDFGFHLALIPFTFGDLMIGAKLAAVTCGAAILASFYAVLRLRRVPLAWLFVFLLAASGGYFAWRISMPRPHVLAVVFSIWSVFLVVERRWIAAGIVGVLYALSYTAPLLPVYAGVYACFCLLLGRSLPRRTVAAAFGGVALGWLLHPHFPNNFQAIWVQLVGVLGSAWGSGGASLALGGELSAADTRTFLTENIVVFSAALVSVYTLTRYSMRLNAEFLTIAFVSLAFFMLACMTVRFVVYFVPFALWGCAEVIGTWVETRRSHAEPRTRGFFVIVLSVGIFAAAVFILGDQSSRLYLSHPFPSKRRFAAEWLAENTPPNSVVFTCDWDDTPELFFYNHSNRYLVFLDPNYFYRWNPRRWKTWRNVAQGKDRDPAWTIQETFGARYGFCTSAFEDLHKQLESDPRATIPVAGPHGYVFEIRDRGAQVRSGPHEAPSAVRPKVPTKN
ncbi:MAG: glycosyltransferase family 87 protein [Planctomycetota bacterium]|jgi:hypothetical protein